MNECGGRIARCRIIRIPLHPVAKVQQRCLFSLERFDCLPVIGGVGAVVRCVFELTFSLLNRSVVLAVGGVDFELGDCSCVLHG